MGEASASSKLMATLEERGSPLASGAEQLARLAEVAVSDPFGGDFDRHVARAGLHPLTAAGVEVLQVNVGKVCNQTCAHCHVDAGPTRGETMSRETADLCLRVLAQTSIPTRVATLRIWTPWTSADPPLIAAATWTASVIWSRSQPFASVSCVDASMQYGHWTACATPSAIRLFSRAVSAPSAKTAPYQSKNFLASSGAAAPISGNLARSPGS